MRHQASALAVIAQRDVTKLLRDRPRLAVNLLFPVTLIAGLGSVLQPSVGRVTGLDAVTLAFTGVLAASLFQSTAAGMISIVEDRENDFSRELFVTPVPRLTLVGGKLLGESLVALCQGACIVGLAYLFGVSMTADRLVAMLGPAVGCCLLGGGFGLTTIAVLPNQRSAMQVFQFLIIPQYVLGGVLTPLHGLPLSIAVLTWAMPVRYGVELMRAAFYPDRGYAEAVTLAPTVAGPVMVVLTVLFVLTGASLFSYRERNR